MSIDTQTQELFATYRQRVGERFDISLDDVGLYSSDQVIDHLQENAQQDMSPASSKAEQFGRTLGAFMRKVLPKKVTTALGKKGFDLVLKKRNTLAFYHSQTHNIYQVQSQPGARRHITLVHELCHAAHHVIAPQPFDGADKYVELAVREGFAHYCSLRYCRDLYEDAPGLDAALADVNNQLKEEMVLSDEHHARYIGTRLFSWTSRTNLSPVDIIKNPPTAEVNLNSPRRYIVELLKQR